jgi:hypothetical protein
MSAEIIKFRQRPNRDADRLKSEEWSLRSDRAYARHNIAEPIYDDRACSEINPEWDGVA